MLIRHKESGKEIEVMEGTLYPKEAYEVVEKPKAKADKEVPKPKAKADKEVPAEHLQK